MKRNAHWLIAKQAREMAEELYEEYARDNRFYRLTGKREGREKFVRRMTQEYLEPARLVLAYMLTRYDVSRETKDQISEALIEDNPLRHGRSTAYIEPLRSELAAKVRAQEAHMQGITRQ